MISNIVLMWEQASDATNAESMIGRNSKYPLSRIVMCTPFMVDVNTHHVKRIRTVKFSVRPRIQAIPPLNFLRYIKS